MTHNSTPKDTEHICPHRNFYMNGHRSIIQKGSQVETTQMALTDKWNAVYPYNRMLFDNENWNADTCGHMDEFG